MDERPSGLGLASEPINDLPAGYRQVYYFLVTDPDKLLWLNFASILLILPFLGLMSLWLGMIKSVRGDIANPLEFLPEIIWLLLVLLVLPLHEWIHGVAIRWAGHQPRYGMKTVDIGPVKVPYVLFATADNALFRRGEFIVIALAPVVAITLGAMGAAIFLPGTIAYYVGLAVIVNGSGAVGDLWMTAVVLRYSGAALVRDQEDSITVYEYYSPTSAGQTFSSIQKADPPSDGNSTP